MLTILSKFIFKLMVNVVSYSPFILSKIWKKLTTAKAIFREETLIAMLTRIIYVVCVPHESMLEQKHYHVQKSNKTHIRFKVQIRQCPWIFNNGETVKIAMSWIFKKVEISKCAVITMWMWYYLHPWKKVSCLTTCRKQQI